MIQEEKAKRYDEAIERAKDFKEGVIHYELKIGENIMDYIFPELKESEDEKIRKDIISFLRSKNGYMNPDEDWDFHNRWLPWLEKQGETAKLSVAKGVLSSCALSFINYLDAHKYEGKMCVSNGECEDIENAFHNAMWDRLHRYYCKYIEKQGEQILANSAKTCKNEQKPAWSEEDEWCLENAIMYCEWARDTAPDVPCYETSEKSISWLKSLKERYTWKPSDEQVNFLEQWLKNNQYKGDARYCYPIFESLYQDLKKLREKQ